MYFLKEKLVLYFDLEGQLAKGQRLIRVSLGWVNVFFIKGKKAVIVDTGPPGAGRRVLNALLRHNIKREEVSLIILTHAHFDHFGGAPTLRQVLSAPLAVHRADAFYLERGENAPIIPLGLFGKVLIGVFRGWAKKRLAIPCEILIEDRLDLSQFGINAYILPTPGHTEGSISVILSDGEAIIGDLLAPHPIFRWRPNLPLFAQEKGLVLESIKMLLSLGINKFYAAHGGPWDREDIEKWILK